MINTNLTENPKEIKPSDVLLLSARNVGSAIANGSMKDNPYSPHLSGTEGMFQSIQSCQCFSWIRAGDLPSLWKDLRKKELTKKEGRNICEFISWIEKDKKVYFLTYDQIYNTPQGEILRKEVGGDKPEDFYGHAAIRKYYGNILNGKEHELTDFSNPKRFPDEIVVAIKNGEFRGLATPKGLLSDELDEDYQAKCKPLDEDYQAKRNSLDEDYQAKRNSLDEDYQAKCNSLYEDYQAKCKPLDEDYQAKRNSLDEDYQAKRNSLYEDYQAKCKPLDEDYQAKRNSLDEDYQAKRNSLDEGFWDLFAKIENRAYAWR
jgi:hypothetical protein